MIKEELLIKEIFMKYILLALLIISSSVSKSQVKRVNYCECKTASSLLTGEAKYPDSVFAAINNDTGYYYIKVFNTTSDTIFLFSSYLQQQFFNSKYLHRGNPKNKEYKISFLPIIPYLFTKYSDVIATSNIIVRSQQVVYDFIKMQPDSYFEVSVPIKDAFKIDKGISDFNPKSMNKFDYKTKFKTIDLKKYHDKNYKLFFELAWYKNVSILCRQLDYYLNENEFNTQAKNFTILRVPVK